MQLAQFDAPVFAMDLENLGGVYGSYSARPLTQPMVTDYIQRDRKSALGLMDLAESTDSDLMNLNNWTWTVGEKKD